MKRSCSECELTFRRLSMDASNAEDRPVGHSRNRIDVAAFSVNENRPGRDLFAAGRRCFPPSANDNRVEVRDRDRRNNRLARNLATMQRPCRARSFDRFFHCCGWAGPASGSSAAGRERAAAARDSAGGRVRRDRREERDDPDARRRPARGRHLPAGTRRQAGRRAVPGAPDPHALRQERRRRRGPVLRRAGLRRGRQRRPRPIRQRGDLAADRRRPAAMATTSSSGSPARSGPTARSAPSAPAIPAAPSTPWPR